MSDALRRALSFVGVRTATGRDAVLGLTVGLFGVGLLVAVARVSASLAGLGLGEDLVPEAALSPGRWVAAVALTLAQGMALTLRRRAPLTALALCGVGQVALAATLPDALVSQGIATLVAAYSAGAYLPRRRALGGAVAVAVAESLFVFALGGPDALPGGTVLRMGATVGAALVAYLGGTLVGNYVATRRELLAQLRERVAQAEREREAMAARAVLEERSRMARELHDVAAHHLSGIVVQAAAAERLVDGSPERAKEAMRGIRTQGRETLDNLRLVVGILRAAEESREGTPQPTLADLPELLALARSAGPVQDETVGTPWALPESTQLTVYRVVQEVLTNARRHAPGKPVGVRLEYGEEALVVTVHNRRATLDDAGTAVGSPATEDLGRGASTDISPAGAPIPGRVTGAPILGAHRAMDARGGAGHGLIGMRERAALVGGTLFAGPTPDGAWRVRLTVPRPSGTDTRRGTAVPATEPRPEEGA